MPYRFVLLLGALSLCLSVVWSSDVCAQTTQKENSILKAYTQQRYQYLKKYASRIERKQAKLLLRLAKQERKIIHSLYRTDSALAKLVSVSISSFDSLRKKGQHHQFVSRFQQTDPTVDTLAKTLKLTQNQTMGLSTLPKGVQVSDLDLLNKNLINQSEINAQVRRRIKFLQGALEGHVPGLDVLEKKAFYTQARFKEWRAIADEPSKIEQKALDILEGSAIFEKGLGNNPIPSGSLPSGTSVLAAASQENPVTAADLEKQGYQTKSQLQALLRQQFGSNLAPLQKQLSEQVNSVRASVEKPVATFKEAKEMVSGLKQPSRPFFRINPMRTLPFIKRLEKGYTFQVSRPQNNQPALLDLGTQISFKHTPSLSYGVGAVVSTGLGEDWNHLQLSIQGVGGRAFVQWDWQYGLGAYFGYERTYKAAMLWGEQRTDFITSPYNNEAWKESLLMGLTKSYKFSSKWKGAVQLLFDAWWREKGYPSPLFFRTTIAK